MLPLPLDLTEHLHPLVPVFWTWLPVFAEPALLLALAALMHAMRSR